MTTHRVTENGVWLPLDSLHPGGIEVGDDVQVIATNEGVSLTKFDPAVQRQLKIADQVMDKRRDVLRRLAE